MSAWREKLSGAVQHVLIDNFFSSLEKWRNAFSSVRAAAAAGFEWIKAFIVLSPSIHLIECMNMKFMRMHTRTPAHPHPGGASDAIRVMDGGGEKN